MTVDEAGKIVADFDENQGITDEDEFMFTEAMISLRMLRQTA